MIFRYLQELEKRKCKKIYVFPLDGRVRNMARNQTVLEDLRYQFDRFHVAGYTEDVCDGIKFVLILCC